MEVLAPFPDAELVVMDVLDSVGATLTRTGSNLSAGTVRVTRVGGADDGITDYPEVEVACYASDRMTAWQMQERCRQLIHASVNSYPYPGGALIDTAGTSATPQQIPDPTTELADPVVATYSLSYRRSRNA